MLKPDGTFWLAIGDEFAAELKVPLPAIWACRCRSWVIWYYTFGVQLHEEVQPQPRASVSFREGPEATSPSTTRRFACRRRGNWSTPTRARIPRGGCPTTPGFSARKTCPTASRRRRYLVLSARLRHLQGAGRLARLPDARTAPGPDHPGLLESGRGRARPVRRQRHDAGRGQEASTAASSASSFRRNTPLRSKRLDAVNPANLSKDPPNRWPAARGAVAEVRRD